MRIAYVCPRYRPIVGGVETHVERLAAAATRLGHDVEVLTQAPRSVGPAVEEIDGTTVRRFALMVPAQHFAVAPGLMRHLRRSAGSYDVVHSHNYHGIPAAMAAVAGAKRLFFTPHYHGTADSAFRRALHRPYKRMGRLILDRADRTICVSGREAKLLAGDFAGIEDRLSVIPNGVDKESLARAEPHEERGRVILSAGRLEHYKHVEAIVEAMPYLPEDYVLRVTGDGPARPLLEQSIARNGLAERVKLLGRVPFDDLNRWFKTASVFVSMSHIEAMPITPLEVMSAGARFVASDIDAHREIASVTGGGVYLVDRDATPQALAERVQEAMAAERVEATVLSWDEVMDRTLEVYGSS